MTEEHGPTMSDGENENSFDFLASDYFVLSLLLPEVLHRLGSFSGELAEYGVQHGYDGVVAGQLHGVRDGHGLRQDIEKSL